MNIEDKSIRRAEIQEAIHKAALAEFAKNGLAGASTGAIAARAGLSKQQLHYYIDGKQELYERTLIDIINGWDQQFFHSLQGEDPRRVISEYVERKIRHALENPLEIRLYSNEVARGAPILKKHWFGARAATSRASEIIAKWVADKKIAPIDPLLFQMHLWAVTQHYADYEAQVRYHMDVDHDEALDADRIIKEAQTLFLRACGIK